MKLIPRFEFDANKFMEMMGGSHTKVNADLFRYFLLDRGYKDTDRIGDNLWSILLEEWEAESRWQETG